MPGPMDMPENVATSIQAWEIGGLTTCLGVPWPTPERGSVAAAVEMATTAIERVIVDDMAPPGFLYPAGIAVAFSVAEGFSALQSELASCRSKTCLLTATPDWPSFRRGAGKRQRSKTPPAGWPGAGWWRRRESNPRPQALRSRTYMLSRLFDSRRALPERQGRRTTSSGAF